MFGTDYALPTVQVGDVRLYYELKGAGDPLALIGGSLFGRQNFGLVYNKLVKHFRVLSYDQRGYGKSDRPIEKYTIDMWADDLAGLLDALKVKRTHVYGTSMGGMIALKFAAKYPKKTSEVWEEVHFGKRVGFARIYFSRCRSPPQPFDS